LAIRVAVPLILLILGCRDSAPPTAPTNVLGSEPNSSPPPFTVDSTPAVDDTTGLPAGRLAFELESYPTRSGDYAGSRPRIYSMRTNGTGLLALTPAGEIGRAPAWSPDGSRLAYEGWHPDAPEIWTVRADGTGRTLVARDASEPFWLDDTHLGFQCGTSLCAIRDDGAERRVLLARDPLPNAADFAYKLSPDGRTIVFTRLTYFGPGAPSSYVYVMNADGTGERRLTPDDEGDSPQWSPVGRSIAYVSARRGIVVADVDAGSVTSIFGWPCIPGWSPTGREVVFEIGDGFDFLPIGGTGPTHRVSLPITFRADVVYQVNAWSWTSR
jgi:Tol biopolymer transport system component